MNNTERVRERLKKHRDLGEIAFWLILGEDTNPDFSGSHNQKPLRVIYGPYGEVVDIAINTPNFFCWGYGGSIEYIEGHIIT